MPSVGKQRNISTEEMESKVNGETGALSFHQCYRRGDQLALVAVVYRRQRKKLQKL